MSHFVLYQKIYDFTLWLYPKIRNIPKRHALGMARWLENTVLSVLTTAVSANQSRGRRRVRLQRKLGVKLSQLKILIRLCKDLKFISLSQYKYAAEQISELERIFQGWVKS